jgi:hypothetical protein
VTKHQGVFPAEKKHEPSANPISDSEKKRERSANSMFQKHFKRMTKFLFFGIFFLFFPEIREKIKERIGKDNKE